MYEYTLYISEGSLGHQYLICIPAAPKSKFQHTCIYTSRGGLGRAYIIYVQCQGFLPGPLPPWLICIHTLYGRPRPPLDATSLHHPGRRPRVSASLRVRGRAQHAFRKSVIGRLLISVIERQISLS